MVKSEKEKAEVSQSDITPAQMKLIAELYLETGYKRQYCQEELAQLDKETASAHIHLLKEYKIRDQALRALNDRVPDFDKIGFGMVFKIVSKRAYEKPMALKPTLDEFSDQLNEEYKIFKYCQDACRQFVKDGGLK